MSYILTKAQVERLGNGLNLFRELNKMELPPNPLLPPAEPPSVHAE